MTTQNIINQVNKTNITGIGVDSALSVDMQKILAQVEKLTDIGIALSAEKDTTQLLEKILLVRLCITRILEFFMMVLKMKI